MSLTPRRALSSQHWLSSALQRAIRDVPPRCPLSNATDAQPTAALNGRRRYGVPSARLRERVAATMPRRARAGNHFVSALNRRFAARLASLRDTPMFCQSRQACLVSLRCISTTGEDCQARQSLDLAVAASSAGNTPKGKWHRRVGSTDSQANWLALAAASNPETGSPARTSPRGVRGRSVSPDANIVNFMVTAAT